MYEYTPLGSVWASIPKDTHKYTNTAKARAYLASAMRDSPFKIAHTLDSSYFRNVIETQPQSCGMTAGTGSRVSGKDSVETNTKKLIQAGYTATEAIILAKKLYNEHAQQEANAGYNRQRVEREELVANQNLGRPLGNIQDAED